MTYPQIAIDGPAGVGKSTAARLLAAALGLTRIDTGALYRAVALAARQQGVGWQDAAQLERLIPTLALHQDPQGRTWLGADDVSHAIRTPEISSGASIVSALPAVRQELLGVQRALAAKGGCVMEGRDIGTVILPDAPVKVFMSASLAVRAKRRYEELLAQGASVDLATVEAEIAERDDRDTNRAVAPLKPAADATILDTSLMTIEEVVGKLVALAEAARQ